jgi:hypothetical protein
LEGRTNYLREIIESIEAGNLIGVRDQPLHPDVIAGTAVYWDSQNSNFDKALAGVINDPASGQFITTEASNVVGICVGKTGPTTGMIALLGMTRMSQEALANMIVGEVAPGRYYLSGTEAGKLVRQRPAVTVAVVYLHGPTDACEEDSWVYINPCMKDFLEDHVHLQFCLAPFPAGDHVRPTGPDDCHGIINPDATKPGWLPADHESFQGKAPAGAFFGYNLAAHPELSRAWPPIPPGSSVLEMYHPLEGHEDEFQGLERVPSEYLRIDKNGIWWCTCCYGKVPWPVDFESDSTDYWIWVDNNDHVWMNASTAIWIDGASSMSASSLSTQLQSSNSLGDVCPRVARTKLVLSFTKMTFATDKTVVTSLQALEGEPIEFVNCVGNAANTGDLHARLVIEALIKSTTTRGGLVIKDIADSSLGFNAGWVTEGLVAGSDVVMLSGTNQVLLDPTLPLSDTNPVLHQGVVTINVQLDPVERELNPQVVKLGDALEREYQGVTYLAFPNGRDSGIRMRYNVPPGGLPTAPKMKIRAKLFGRSVGPFSAMEMRYYRITRPGAGVPFPIVSGDTNIAFDVVTPSDDSDGSGTDLPADQVIEVESEEFSVEPGDTVFVELIRMNDAGPLYQNDIGLIRIGGIIVP